MIVAGGDWATVAVSLVSQVGIGYMNYRKAKADAKLQLEKDRWQLERTAIEQFNGLRRELFRGDATPYSALAVEDVVAAIRNSDDVEHFKAHFNTVFRDFPDWLRERLIQPLQGGCVTTNEEEISDSVFDRLSSVPLVDRYEAYQLLHQSWEMISADLETIHRESFSATRCVDPRMVWKKKGNVEQEVQEGWMGRIIPFELAQKELLAGELAALKAHEDRLAEISGSYEEALDGLSEEDKEADFVNEDKTAFVWAEVKKAIKAKEVEPEVLAASKEVSPLTERERP
jgi:type I restriction enzyme M protein